MSSYNVVMKNTLGQVTWSTFESKEKFDEWYSQKMQDGSERPISEVYEIVAEGVSPDEATRIASEGNTLENDLLNALRKAEEGNPEDPSGIFEMEARQALLVRALQGKPVSETEFQIAGMTAILRRGNEIERARRDMKVPEE